MSRYVLVPDDPMSGKIKIMIPSGLMDHDTKQLKDPSPTEKAIKRTMRRLTRRGMVKNSAGEAVHNGHVLKGVKYHRAVYYAALGIKKRKYSEINELL